MYSSHRLLIWWNFCQTWPQVFFSSHLFYLLKWSFPLFMAVYFCKHSSRMSAHPHPCTPRMQGICSFLQNHYKYKINAALCNISWWLRVIPLWVSKALLSFNNLKLLSTAFQCPYLSLVTRKPVFGVCDQGSLKLRGYAGWSAPLLFEYGKNRFFTWRGSFRVWCWKLKCGLNTESWCSDLLYLCRQNSEKLSQES